VYTYGALITSLIVALDIRNKVDVIMGYLWFPRSDDIDDDDKTTIHFFCIDSRYSGLIWKTCMIYHREIVQLNISGPMAHYTAERIATAATSVAVSYVCLSQRQAPYDRATGRTTQIYHRLEFSFFATLT
jgi:hypothetical protein